MPVITASASAEIAAPPERVHGIIADYRRGHPSILPPRYFRNLVVQEGGTGAGTVIHFGMTVLGRTTHVRGHVTEPEPGRPLVEHYPDSATETEFLVEPLADGRSSRVAFLTRYQKPGLAGWLERVVVPGVLRRIYREELANLAEAARC